MRKVRRFEAYPRHSCAAVLRGHTGAVYSVRFDGGVHCATAAMDGAVRVWDVVEGEEAGRLKLRHVRR